MIGAYVGLHSIVYTTHVCSEYNAMKTKADQLRKQVRKEVVDVFPVLFDKYSVLIKRDTS